MICQVAFAPIESVDYLADIKHVIKLIANSNIDHQVGTLSTMISGEKSKIFALLEDIYSVMDSRCGFTMDVKISNLCGQKQQDES
ncbi:MAG: thiamine-binding protein [Bacilli bacterium]|nr:thiamine-binding protein [Bacilli bacterium]